MGAVGEGAAAVAGAWEVEGVAPPGPGNPRPCCVQGWTLALRYWHRLSAKAASTQANTYN